MDLIFETDFVNTSFYKFFLSFLNARIW